MCFLHFLKQPVDGFQYKVLIALVPSRPSSPYIVRSQQLKGTKAKHKRAY